MASASRIDHDGTEIARSIRLSIALRLLVVAAIAPFAGGDDPSGKEQILEQPDLEAPDFIA